MVAPIIWGGVALAGLWFGGRAINEAGDAAESTAKLAKWATAGGALYVSYQAMRSAGVLK